MPITNYYDMLKTKREFEQEAEQYKLNKRLLESQVAKNEQLDADKMGELAFVKAAQGIPLTVQEQAYMKLADAKSQGFSANPATGDYYYKPPLSQRMGLGGGSAQPTPFATGMGAGGVVPPISYGDLGGGYGGGSSVPPPAPNMAPQGNPINRPTGLTNRGLQTFMDENTKADRKRLDDIIASSGSAADAKSAAARMKELQPDLGYTGVGATPLAFFDKGLTAIGAGGLIPGAPAAREAFEKEGVNAWVKAVEPLKGSLTEREGARFDRAVPSLSMTPEGIALLNETTIAIGQRAQEKSQFYQDYYNQNGTLNGADQIWNQYAEQNPVVPENFDQLINQSGGEKKSFKKGATATNPQTGERLMFDGTTWKVIK